MRIANKFKELQANNRKALIAYITAGDPGLATTEKAVLALEKAGADIIELGIPYSDPLADGPVIQRATERALQSGTTLNKVFQLVEKLRSKTQIPLVFLVYYNPVLQYGLEEFVARCEEVGIDGIIIPDLPLEEREELKNIMAEANSAVDLIPLVAPTSAERVAAIVEQATGFVYCISSTGVTGQRDTFVTDLDNFIKHVKKYTDIPAAIGFGISNIAGVEQLKDFADGLIIGSAIVEQIEEAIHRGQPKNIPNVIYDFVKPLRDTLDS